MKQKSNNDPDFQQVQGLSQESHLCSSLSCLSASSVWLPSQEACFLHSDNDQNSRYVGLWTLWSSSSKGRDSFSLKRILAGSCGHILTLKLHVTCFKASLAHMPPVCIWRASPAQELSVRSGRPQLRPHCRSASQASPAFLTASFTCVSVVLPNKASAALLSGRLFLGNLTQDILEFFRTFFCYSPLRFCNVAKCWAFTWPNS